MNREREIIIHAYEYKDIYIYIYICIHIYIYIYIHVYRCTPQTLKSKSTDLGRRADKLHGLHLRVVGRGLRLTCIDIYIYIYIYT